MDGLHGNYRLFLPEFDKTWNFRDRFSEKTFKCQKFRENRSGERRVVHTRTEGQTDRHDEAQSRFPQFSKSTYKNCYAPQQIGLPSRLPHLRQIASKHHNCITQYKKKVRLQIYAKRTKAKSMKRSLPRRKIFPVKLYGLLTVWRLTTHIWVVPHR